MPHFILFDDERWEQLLPLTFTRPVAEILIGINSISEKWIDVLQSPVSYLTELYLSDKFPSVFSNDNIYINGGIIPDEQLAEDILQLKEHESLIYQNTVIALRTADSYFSRNSFIDHKQSFTQINYTRKLISISRTWEIFQLNDLILRNDFKRITKNNTSLLLSPTNIKIGDQIFIEEGAVVEASILNSKAGPIYIGKYAEVMEGSMLRGPISIGMHSTIKMGAKIYGATSIGDYCKVGGEINNTIFHAYSNKAHDGFIGNSVVGSWCNLGADTNTSNLKNNYAIVKLWDYPTQRFVETGTQFCGLIMGDFSKCGINTMLNTGTIVGVNANIFGDGFPRNFIPSFSWGGASGFTTYKIKDALATAEIVMKRRNIEMSESDKMLLTNIYSLSEKYRKGELIFLRK